MLKSIKLRQQLETKDTWYNRDINRLIELCEKQEKQLSTYFDKLMNPFSDLDYPILAGDMRRGFYCGVEDRDLYDRYDCAEYGWNDCEERLQEWMRNLVSSVYAD